MRVTVCELPHDPRSLRPAWKALCDHTRAHPTQLVVLPEFAFVEPVWESESFDAQRWADAESLTDTWLARLPELGAPSVIGARPVTIDGRPFNQGFLWSAGGSLRPLRRKYFLPDDPGGRELRWFDRGDAEFPIYDAGQLRFGLSICTELWALENAADYALGAAHAIVSPRATAASTAAKWLAVGTVNAVRAGAYSLSSNRIDPSGRCGGGGWVIDPDGQLLARTFAEEPFVTVDIDLARAEAAKRSYPRDVFTRVP